MTIPLRHTPRSPQGGDTRIELLLRFFAQHSEALAQAADLLGGPAAEGRARRLAGAAACAPRLSPALRRELEALHALLSLEDVDDLDGPEAGFFAMIDPAWPVVEDLCLLTDELTALLDAIDRLDAEDDAPPAVRAAASRAA